MNRHYDFMKTSRDFTATIAIAALLITVTGAHGGEKVSGPATVISGDVLVVQGNKYKLFGIRAPDLAQTCEWPAKTIPCGDISRTALMDLVVASQVDCVPLDNTVSPMLARCYVDGFDVGRNMIHTGWAVAAPDGSADYRAIEDTAKIAKRGLWKGNFERP